MILPSSEGGFSGARTVDGNICIGDTSLRNYMPENIKPMINIKNITRGCKTCINDMLLQLDLNKWRISRLPKLDKLCINYASTRILESSKCWESTYFMLHKLSNVWFPVTLIYCLISYT